MSIDIPEIIQNFIKQEISIECLCLPQDYLDLKKVNKIQAGFRYNALTNESTIGTQRGDWKEDWYVIATNYFLDPFIVKLKEEKKGFPVYFDICGGDWSFTKVADSLSKFENILKQIANLEQMNETDRLLSFLKENTNLKNKLWKEVHETIEEESEEPLEEVKAPSNKKSTENNTLPIITNVGANRAKVANYLKQKIGLSLQQALDIIKAPKIVLKNKNNIQFDKQDIDYLISIGATVQQKDMTAITLEKEHAYTLRDLIDIALKNESLFEPYCIYTTMDTFEEEYDKNMICYVDDYPNDDDIEPDFVVKNNLEYYYMGQQFTSIIHVATDEKVKAYRKNKQNTEVVSMKEFIQSLEYYSDNDTFMTFD